MSGYRNRFQKWSTSIGHVQITPPLILSISTSAASRGCFRFINAWASHHKFLDVVKEAWAEEAMERPMVKFSNKLKNVRRKLKGWNKDIFGKVDQRVCEAEDRVLQMEFLFENDPTEENKVKLCKAKTEVDDRLKTEESVWRQKANIKWVKEGDHNTVFSPTSEQEEGKLFIHQIKGANDQ